MTTLKYVFKAILFPVYSIFSRRTGFAVFLPTFSGWWLFTRGKFIKSSGPPGMTSLEYFRYFVPRKGEIVFDVGGERGNETIQFSRMVGPSGKVFTFECFPPHIEELKKIQGRYSNVCVVEHACWNRSGKLRFFEGHSPGSNTAIPSATGHEGQALANEEMSVFSVDAQPLDFLWENYASRKPIGFLKMDIEGAEWEALEGASKLLRRTAKVVIAAYHHRDGVVTAPKVAQLLHDAGFSVTVGDNFHVYGTRRLAEFK